MHSRRSLKRRKPIQVYVTDDQYRHILAESTAQGISMSGWMVSLVEHDKAKKAELVRRASRAILGRENPLEQNTSPEEVARDILKARES